MLVETLCDGNDVFSCVLWLSNVQIRRIENKSDVSSNNIGDFLLLSEGEKIVTSHFTCDSVEIFLFHDTD